MKRLFFVFCFVLTFAGTLFAQSGFDAGARRLSQEEAAERLEEFRNFQMSGGFCLKFRITHKPRDGGEETYFTGTLFGAWVDGARRLRVSIRKFSDGEETDSQSVRKMLIAGGENPELWELGQNGVPEKIDAKNTEPFFEGAVFSPFDLQTPFVFWNDFEYLKTERLRGRVSHFYDLFPPEKFKAEHPEISAVRIALDRAYNTLVKVETFDENKKTLKTFSLGSVKKIKDDYIFKTLDVRDGRSRDRDTFEVTSAALRIKLPDALFVPETLSKPDPALPPHFFERL